MSTNNDVSYDYYAYSTWMDDGYSCPVETSRLDAENISACTELTREYDTIAKSMAPDDDRLVIEEPTAKDAFLEALRVMRDTFLKNGISKYHDAYAFGREVAVELAWIDPNNEEFPTDNELYKRADQQ